jgi:hypothetical protein
MTKAKKRKAEYEKKCREYSRFLKDDHDYDGESLLYLMRFKLQKIRECIAKGFCADREERAEEIKQVEDLLWKVCDFDYHGEAFASFNKKHGEPKMVSRECNPPRKGFKTMHFIYRNGKEATPAMSREIIRLHKLSEERQKEDLKKALDIIVEKIWGWWD